MGSRGLMHILRARRFIVLAGLVLSLILGGWVLIITPRTYTSSGTALLMKQNGPNSINPLLAFPPDDSLSITALMLVQFMNGPDIPADLGLMDGRDTFTVKNGGSSAVKIDGIAQPFYTVTAQSGDPAKSEKIVADVITRSRQELEVLQTAFKVPPGEAVLLVSVVGPTPPAFAWDIQVRAVLVALLLGVAGTVATACVYDRRVQLRSPQVGSTDFEAPMPDAARQSTNGGPGVSAISGERR
jgi:hypothetical protein